MALYHLSEKNSKGKYKPTGNVIKLRFRALHLHMSEGGRDWCFKRLTKEQEIEHRKANNIFICFDDKGLEVERV
ncbi:hypothetical protein ACFLZ7_01940 [Nanoarchaeota archaeon]